LKKSIKYAGIAAATLLAVAPVAAPVVSTVTTANAADVSDADASALKQDINDFTGQFGNTEKTDGIINTIENNNNFPLGEAAAKSVTDFNAGMTGLIKSPTTSALTKLDGQGAKVYITAQDTKGNSYDGVSVGGTRNDLAAAMKLDSQLPITFTVHMQYRDLAFNTMSAYKDVATFDITKSTTNELKSINAKFTTPLNVAKNSKTAATQLTNSSNLSLTDQDGDSVATSSIKVNDHFYYTYAAALDAAKDATSTSGIVSEGGSDINGGEFKTAGTYYQTITYTAATGSALASMLKAYQNDPSGYTVYVNGKEASNGYDFTSAALTDGTTQTISFVRAIKVSDSSAEWTTSAVDGIVTTKSDKSYYTLNNDEGNTVKNRALAKNTAWKADKVRTDQNGNKQYRVATGEWIDANDVTFGDTATTDTGALTDIQSVKGIVKLDNAGFTYFLYNKAGDQLKTRALSGNSSWQVINTAKDSEGNTYYRVATDEWVMQGNGVTFN